jgi:hypothetical protein
MDAHSLLDGLGAPIDGRKYAQPTRLGRFCLKQLLGSAPRKSQDDGARHYLGRKRPATLSTMNSCRLLTSNESPRSIGLQIGTITSGQREAPRQCARFATYIGGAQRVASSSSAEISYLQAASFHARPRNTFVDEWARFCSMRT